MYLQPRAESVATRVLAQYDVVLHQANGLSVHDLVRAFVLQNPVLVYPRLVCECISTYYCLVRLQVVNM